jgi:hypothetical protein
MKSRWTQDVAFPIIARAIERLHRDPTKFVARQEIVKLLLRETHSRWTRFRPAAILSAFGNVNSADRLAACGK